MNDEAATFREACARCGRSLLDGDWHPVETRSEGGELVIYSFCDEACHSSWTAE